MGCLGTCAPQEMEQTEGEHRVLAFQSVVGESADGEGLGDG